jgi:plasmid stability protein
MSSDAILCPQWILNLCLNMTKVIIENLDPIVVEKLEIRANRHGRSLQAELREILLLAILDTPQAIANLPLSYLVNLEQEVKNDMLRNEKVVSIQEDPLIGLFSGAADLSEKSEEVLEQEIHDNTGWSWKQ